MNVYLVQHGRPVPEEENPDRPLSSQGRKDVERTATFLKQNGVKVQAVFHSGKTRARETAEIIASRLQPNKETLEKKGLSPLDDVREIAHEIENSQSDLMIVGHLPHLAKLASFLITGNESIWPAGFQQGGVLCIRRAEAEKGWVVAWMVVPEILS